MMEEYQKSKLAWEQEQEGGSYNIIEPGSEQELRMLEANLEINMSRRPKLYEQRPELKAELEAQIRALRLKLYGMDSPNHSQKGEY